MTSRKIITVDGLLSTGKTSISKELAKMLNFSYLSSGLFYRGLAYIYAELEKSTDFDDQDKIISVISPYKLALTEDSKGAQKLLINDVDQSKNLFSDLVTQSASKIAKHLKVRELLIDLQRDAFPGRNLVAEGRDMGSVIFPDADLKFYIKVDSNIKAERRFKQMYEGQKLSESEAKNLKLKLKTEIEERDLRDSTREHSPTVVPEGAIIVDNSYQTLTQVVKNMYNLAVSRI